MNKINFDTAKKIKELGWPQLGDGDALVLNFPLLESDETVTVIPWALYVHNPMPNHEVVYGPTLQELIDACGEENFILGKSVDKKFLSTPVKWDAQVYDSHHRTIGEGETASEAVANLWIKLR